MMVKLHANATTTPKIRQYIRESDKPIRELARELGLTVDTVSKWKKRTDVNDRSHTAHRLQKTLTDAQEVLVVELRRSLLLPLDDLLVVVREFIQPDLSRSALSRCLRRMGVGNLRDLMPKPEGSDSPKKRFKDYEPGFIHMDIKYLPMMPDEKQRKYLFVAIDRASRWVVAAIRMSTGRDS